MAEVNGADIVVAVETSAGSGTFTIIGGQRDATITKEVAEVDFSSKNSHHEKLGYGRHGSTVTMEALYTYPYAQGWARLQAARDNREHVLLQKVSNVAIPAQGISIGDPYEQALAVITNLDE